LLGRALPVTRACLGRPPWRAAVGTVCLGNWWRPRQLTARTAWHSTLPVANACGVAGRFANTGSAIWPAMTFASRPSSPAQSWRTPAPSRSGSLTGHRFACRRSRRRLGSPAVLVSSPRCWPAQQRREASSHKARKAESWLDSQSHVASQNYRADRPRTYRGVDLSHERESWIVGHLSGRCAYPAMDHRRGGTSRIGTSPLPLKGVRGRSGCQRCKSHPPSLQFFSRRA
jgi:hypothetical protein